MRKYLLLVVVLLAVLAFATSATSADIGVQTPLPEEVYCPSPPDRQGVWPERFSLDMSKYCHCNRWIPTKGCIETNKVDCILVGGRYECHSGIWEYPEGFWEIEWPEPELGQAPQKVTVTGIADISTELRLFSINLEQPFGEPFYASSIDGLWAIHDASIDEWGFKVCTADKAVCSESVTRRKRYWWGIDLR